MATTTTTPAVIESAPDQPGVMGRAVYAFGYWVSFGVSLPTMLVVRALPLDNALGWGLRDGARAADQAALDTHVRLGYAAGAVANKANDTYAGVTQFVQERVERVQDKMAERRHRRGLQASAPSA